MTKYLYVRMESEAGERAACTTMCCESGIGMLHTADSHFSTIRSATYIGVTGFDKGMGEVEGKSKRNPQSLGYGTNTKSTSYSVYLMVCEKYFPRT